MEFTDANNDGVLDGTGIDADGKVIGGTDGYTVVIDADSNTVADFIQADFCNTDIDNDGVRDDIDLDSDNDGILNTEEGTDDLDGDGIPNLYDLDSDGDGCYDIYEANFTDADNNGVLDGTGVDANGKVTGGTDGYTGALDADNDSVADFIQADYCDTDTDGDGVRDSVDLDDDNDGILDTEEGTGDLDGDGIPNYLDLDSDGDTCYDVLEAGFTDGFLDGILDGTGVDTDGKVIGTDGYTTPNAAYLDDSVFAACDLDNDGYVNSLDPDDDNDMIFDTAEGTGDLDGDGIPNYLDLDSDGDGCYDIYEILKSTYDKDQDGRRDSNVGYYGTGYNDKGTSQDASQCPLDTDGDYIPDENDSDDDNDGIRDSYEGTGDLDGDGIPNKLDLDSDGDGCYDAIESTANNELSDLNPDGSIKYDFVASSDGVLISQVRLLLVT